jgi:two-component system osmolarity sensor histidine kinase EnvZ
MSRTLSLSQQNALKLAVVFICFEALAALAVVFLLMLPLAHRATSDLAGMMVLSAQTWSELPPDTRPAFTQELIRAHGLTLADALPTGTQGHRWHGVYVRELADQLAERIGQPVDLISMETETEPWLWVPLATGEQTLWMGFPRSRVGPQPLAAATLTLAAALLLAGLAAWWLGHSTVAPFKRIGAAAAALGRGAIPELLPETGPLELAQLARRFNALARQIHDLLEARTTLLAGLSHDLRTPLARMRLALEMLQRRPDPQWITRLETDVEGMNRLIGAVLDLARGLSSEPSVTVDLREMLATLADQARETGADVALRCPDLQLMAPPVTLHGILSNLLSNAQRYAGDRPIEMRAELADNDCTIGILDQGPGIPEDQLQAVFRPFHRVEASRSPVSGGSGLGLAIVHQLAQANGWEVWLENRPGGGLAAWVRIPAPVEMREGSLAEDSRC